MEEKEVAKLLATGIMDLKNRTEILLAIDNDLADKIVKTDKIIKKLSKSVKMVDSKVVVLQLTALATIYCIYKLDERLTKLQAKVTAIEAEKDITEFENKIEEND